INLGVSPLRTFLKIMVPLMGPGLIAGATLAWIEVFNELSASIVLYTAFTRTLPVATYQEVFAGNFGTAAALAAMLIMITADALARFLYRAAASGELASWDDQTLVREANASLMALYRRLGIVATTDADAGRRFRAGMAVARATKEGLRLTSVALPGVRIDGQR